MGEGDGWGGGWIGERDDGWGRRMMDGGGG